MRSLQPAPGLPGPAQAPEAGVRELVYKPNTVDELCEVVSRLAAEGVDIAATSPAEFAAFIRDETAKWSRVVKAAGIKVE